MSRKYWGDVVREGAEGPRHLAGLAQRARPAPTRRPRGPSGPGRCGPATISLKSPPLPMPRTGGGATTNRLASWISLKAALSFAAISGPDSPGPRSAKSLSPVKTVPEWLALELRDDRQAGEGHDPFHAGSLQRDLRGPLDDLGGALEGRALGQFDDGDQVALVLLGNEAGGDEEEADAGQHQHHGEGRRAPGPAGARSGTRRGRRRPGGHRSPG